MRNMDRSETIAGFWFFLVGEAQYNPSPRKPKITHLRGSPKITPLTSSDQPQRKSYTVRIASLPIFAAIGEMMAQSRMFLEMLLMILLMIGIFEHNHCD